MAEKNRIYWQTQSGLKDNNQANDSMGRNTNTGFRVYALREVTSVAHNKRDTLVDGGNGLINELLNLSNPLPAAQYESGKKWNQFVKFVRDILDDSQAEVRIDANATMITVKTDGTDYLSLSDLGTGIEQLVILAAVVSCNTNSLIVIEEPEVHLHPTLQAKIVKNLLEDENGNRFIITTHSPTIINSEGVSITWVEKEGGVSRAREVCDTVSAREVLDDIGAHPSDLLQSNYIIWVEGPSDRVYVNYWLSSVAPELREGVHYSVMLYGGRLLNACDAGPEDAPEELISLFRINPHFCVIMDSDRKREEAPISETKMRIEEECKRSDCMSWVTAGKTIENYVPADVLRDALREVHGDKQYDGELDNKYKGPLDSTFKGVTTRPDKIRIARAVVRRGYEPDQDLREKVEELARRIRKVNGMLGAGGEGSYLLQAENDRDALPR